MRKNSHVLFCNRDEIQKRTIDYNPKKTKYRKQHRGRMKGISRRGNSISFGRCRYALQALEPAWIEEKTIEAGRRAIKRCVRSWAKIWVFPHEKPFRMNNSMLTDYILRVKSGYILFEISSTISETIARRTLALADYRMPIKTQFIFYLY